MQKRRSKPQKKEKTSTFLNIHLITSLTWLITGEKLNQILVFFFVRSSKNDRKRGFKVEKTFQADELSEKLPRLDISEVGNLEQRDVFHARQDHPELEHCNTPPTSTTISSQVQQSITTFTSGGDVSNRSHPNNEPTIEEISKKLDKVIAIVSP